MTTLTYAVFIDDKGNEYVFPSIVADSDKGTRLDFWQIQEICFATGLTRGKDKVIEVIDDVIDLPHVKGEIGHRSFLHGYASVYIIGGPDFEEILNEQNA